MPVVSITLDSVQKNILIPSYSKIINDISRTLKFPKTALTILHNNKEIALTDSRSNVSVNETTNLPTTVSKRRLIATVNEDYNEDSLTSTAVHQHGAFPIFRDVDISVAIFPIYVKSDITIDISYISPSLTEATRIRDDARIRLSQTRNVIVHEVDYTILIPEVVEDFIVDIHELKNRLDPMSLEEYFRIYSTKRIYPITDMSNKENTRLGIYEKQVRFIGTFEFSPMPEKIEHDTENNNYKFSFSYKVSMDVPRAMALRYPVMMCNRLMPSKYIKFLQDHIDNSQEESRKVENYTSFGNYNLSMFEAHRELSRRIDVKLPVNVPAFDEFKTRQNIKGYAILASFLTDVDETDYRSLFNLKDIDPYDIDDELLEFIKVEERNYITKPYESFMYLGLHQEGRFFDSDVLALSPELAISSNKILTLFKPIRVTLSFCIDISMLKPGVLDRYKKYPNILLLLLKEYLEAVANFKTEGSGSVALDKWYQSLIDLIRYYLDLDDLTMVCNLLQIPTLYSNVETGFARLLYLSYPGLFRELLRRKMLFIDTRDFTMKVLCALNLTESQLIDVMSKGRTLPASLLATGKNTIGNEGVGIMKTVMQRRVIVNKL